MNKKIMRTNIMKEIKSKELVLTHMRTRARTHPICVCVCLCVRACEYEQASLLQITGHEKGAE
jgi:hypothetical protein